MASSDPEIKDGLTLPVWMKSKPTKEFEPFTASPPDDIFYIRYPKTDILFGKTTIEQDFSKLTTTSKEVTAARAFNAVKEKDWSKHTKPCQEVLHSIAPINTAVNSITTKPKPAGIDDGFKGEDAACGTSVVKVAHQMMTAGGSRGFSVASPPEEPPAEHPRLLGRRGSKSLPVTPAHSPNASPTSRRRMNANRYFTSPFEPAGDTQSRSWLTSALLGFKRDLAASSSALAEEDARDLHAAGSLAESVESLGPAPQRPSSHATTQPQGGKSQAFRPKPSELREMNFWSPTSM